MLMIKKKREMEAVAFVGFFFLGIAVGALYGRWDAAPFIGISLGFISALFVKMRYQ